MGEVKVTQTATEEVRTTAVVTVETTKEAARETKVQRNYKDTVSRMLFRKPENALSLYNALNGTSYTDASQITFNMLDNAIYMGMQNDISFLIMNEELKEKCPVLKQYTQYVELVRYNSIGMPLEQAVETAIEYCIRHDILKDFLLKQRAEVVKMSIFEYDEEREIELIRRDEREIGAQKERQKAEQELKKERQRAQAEMDKNRENTIRSIISICKEMGGDQEVVAQKLMKNCNLNEEQAKEKVALYWE